jgi:hypothetical protein
MSNKHFPPANVFISRRNPLFKLALVCCLLLLALSFHSEFRMSGGTLEVVNDRRVRTWVFVAHDQSPEMWIEMTKRCVVSALERTSLVPVCVFYGSPKSPLVSWLESHDVKIIFHTPKWIPKIEAVVNSEVGRINTRWSPLYGSSVGLVSTFLRLDLPLLLSPEEHGPLVLYTDTDVMFRRMVTFDDFVAKGTNAAPDYFIMGTEGGRRYHKKKAGNINAGVMLINLSNMRITYDDFVEWVFSSKNMARGLHFGSYGPGDQGAYNEYYVNKFPIVESPLFNWKPYWGWNDKACIVHFHGAKPVDYAMEFGHGTVQDGDVVKSNPNFKVLFQWCVENSVVSNNDCLRWVDEFHELSISVD